MDEQNKVRPSQRRQNNYQIYNTSRTDECHETIHHGKGEGMDFAFSVELAREGLSAEKGKK